MDYDFIMMDGFTCEAEYFYGNPLPNMEKTPPFFACGNLREKPCGVSQDLSYHPAEAGDCPKAVMEISGSSAPKRRGPGLLGNRKKYALVGMEIT